MKIAGLWGLFALSHMVLSSDWLRPKLVARVGQNAFLVAYSLLAFFIIAPLFGTYMKHKHDGPLLWNLPHEPWLIMLVSVGVAVAFVLFAAGFMTPSPVIRGMPYDGPRGAHLISRHCLFMGFALWALMHLLVNGYATDVVFFGGFVVFSIVGSVHQDRRKLASGDPVFAEFHAATPFFPFTGKHTLKGLRGFSKLAVVAGLGLMFLFRRFHGELFG
jgi:uncharacterized membrane protein